MNQMQAFTALDNMRARLLDLTARNRLINFRHTKTGSLRVINGLPNQLAESLLADKEIRFEAIPEPTEKELIDVGYLEFNEEKKEITRLKNPPLAEEWAKHLGFMTTYEVPKILSQEDASKNSVTTIQTLLYPCDMEALLKSLSSQAESAIQEMGANILYLAFGFLEWYENATSDTARFAPLFLVPTKLNKGRLNPQTRTYEYRLQYSGEEIIPNLSLREKLRADFAMALPELDENTIPEDYLREISQLIQDRQPRWRVRRYISLSLLNFSKLLMYRDLDPERWPQNANIVDHPVVSQFLSGYGQNSVNEAHSIGNLGFGEEYPLDDMSEVHARYPLIDDADSSQHSALIDAIDGRSLVIEGPPGTGKSQTITNLIAAALAQGKTVLFVAEKLAALEVVRNRLDRAGLGEFCLELHSHKSQKRKVLDEIGERLKKNGHYRPPKDIEADIARYEELKNTLKRHAEKINQKWARTGKTLHEIFTAATRYREAIGIDPQRLHPTGYNGDNYDVMVQRRNEDQVAVYRKVYQSISEQLTTNATLQDHPWYGVRNSDLQIFDLEQVKAALGTWQNALLNLQIQRDTIVQTLNIESLDLAQSLTQIRRLSKELQVATLLHGDELLDCLPILRGKVLEKTKLYLKLFESIQDQYETLSKIVPADVFVDLSVVDQLIIGAQQLGRFVGREVDLRTLSKAIHRLTVMENQLNQLDEPLRGIVSALGEPAANWLMISESGLTEFKIVVGLIISLDPSHWKQRDELFDNDELDTVLPRLKAELEALRKLHAKIKSIFVTADLPDEKIIRQIGITLRSGGLFKWFQRDWRAARKKLLSLAANGQVTLHEMLSALDDLAKFAEKREKLRRNTDYTDILGEHIQGLDTDLDTLEALRTWYRAVRQSYGVGFGPKVRLGDAILDLSPNIAKAVRSLSERGLQKQLNTLLDDLNNLKTVFAPCMELQNTSTLLVGDEGVIPRLINAVKQAVKACGSLVNDEALTVAELVNRIEQLHLLHHRVSTWKKADFDGKLFSGKLNLQVGVAIANSKGLSMLRHTLDLATSLAEHVETPAIINYLNKNPQIAALSTLVQHAKQLHEALTIQDSAYENYVSIVHLDRDGWSIRCFDRVDNLILRNQRALDNGETLQNWLSYIRSRKQLEQLGMGVLANAVEHGDIQINEVEIAYRAGIYDLLAREILHKEPDLERFSGRNQEALQDDFCKYDNKIKMLQCEQIAWKIDQRKIPIGHYGARASERTERVLLEFEVNKKAKHISIRQLLRRASNALIALKPCFMMGPMSVAQYLAPGEIVFDLVVMDEASQIKPQDALGAVARGTQLVVVGDPKQLPPTSFFDHLLDDDADPTGIEESESILDAALAMFPVRRLRWHYRSQHETLIAFSNHFFYDSNLILFPSPHKDNRNYGIQYLRVPKGCFVNRKNLEEARMISKAVREHFQHHFNESLGVVAMNAEQKQQIESAIEALAKDDAIFQEWLDKDAARNESLFIKNLENVQGDERDVIFISMTYGPSEPGGKVYQRFGPINSAVGGRRLNVLFTRSKKRMHIFSSMGSEDIVIGPTSKQGVQALRNFLSFCETGILYDTQLGARAPDSDFEIAVMEALARQGFKCIPQVGVAGFFIDVAVVDPNNPGRYLMGIECDGATYHSSKSARDRDRLRQTILERLGWRIRRIWSTDWFKNPHGELSPIIRELNALKTPVVTDLESVNNMNVSVQHMILTGEHA